MTGANPVRDAFIPPLPRPLKYAAALALLIAVLGWSALW